MSGGILFVENREKTHFWAAVGRCLAGRGVQVDWLVQNPAFAPRDAGNVHLIGYPKARDLGGGEIDMADFAPVITDRGRQYFNAGTAHYAFYRRRIDTIVASVRPALIVGESSLIQELFAIEAAEKHGAVFVHPGADRYPHDRFSLLIGESQVPFVESGHRFDPVARRDLSERIGSARTMPRYMIKPGRLKQHWNKLRWAVTRLPVLSARYRGERYNTPSIKRKLVLAKLTKRNGGRWDAIARVPEGRAILYPMQLQPEASIDVWGRPYSNQLAVIRQLLAAAPGDISIAVKANPKIKYEMTDALLDLAEADARIALLPRAMSMVEAHALTLGAVTVCGTVGLEAIFGRGRCVSLRHPSVTLLFPRCAAETPEEAVRKLLDDPGAGVGSVEMGERLLDHLGRYSFAGLVSDPFSMPECLNAENVEAVANGIETGWRKAVNAEHRASCEVAA